jgi:hypothetical protein
LIKLCLLTCLLTLQAIAATMSSADAFKKELTAMQDLLRQQSAIIPVADMNQLLSIQACAFAKRVKTLSTNDVDAQYVSDITILMQKGPWSKDQLIELSMALCSLLTSTSTPAKQSSRRGQEIRHFQHYLSAPEALLVGDASKPIVAKIDTVIHRMSKLEITLPSEQSLKHIMTVILVTTGDVIMDAKTIRSWYVQFKSDVHSRFKNVKEAGPIGHIVKWPEHPSQLDEKVRNIAYADAPPVSLDVSDSAMNKVSNAVAMRKNAAILRDTSDMQLLPAPAAGSSSRIQLQDQLIPLMHTYYQFMQGQSGPRDQAGQRVNIQYMQDQAGPSRTAEAQLAQPHCRGPLGGGQYVQSPEPTTGNEIVCAEPTVCGSPEDQAKKFLASMRGTGDDADDDDDEDDDDDDVVTSKPAAKLKAPKPKAKPQAKGTSKPKAKPQAKGTISKSKVGKPTYGIERSRSQVQCRTGLAGPGQSKAFKFSDFKNGLKGAEAAAIKWVAAAKRTL